MATANTNAFTITIAPAPVTLDVHDIDSSQTTGNITLAPSFQNRISTLSNNPGAHPGQNGGGAYTTFAAWLAGQGGDLVAANATETLECYANAAGLVETVDLRNKFTTDATHTVTIKAAAGNEHDGVSGAGFWTTSSASANAWLFAFNNYMTIQDIEIRQTGAAPTFQNSDNTGCVVQRCIFRQDNTGNVIALSSSSDAVVRNNLCIKAGTSGRAAEIYAAQSGAMDNNTFLGGAIGLNRASASGTPTIVRNNVAYDNATAGFDGATAYWDAASSNNASGDNSVVDEGIGTVVNVAASDFVNYAGGDYMPADDGVLFEAGITLDTDFTDTIQNTTRVPPWDIGAWENPYVAPTVDAGGPYSGDVGSPIPLDATVTAGTDASPTLLWTEPSGLGGTFNDPAIEDPTFTPSAVGAYTLRLTADPDDGSSVADTADLTSNAIPPSGVSAGGPYSGEIDQATQLAGTYTAGSDPTPTLTWSIDSGGTGTFLPSPNAEDPTFTPDNTGAYVLRFSVDPSDGAPVEATANFTSNPPTGVVVFPDDLDQSQSLSVIVLTQEGFVTVAAVQQAQTIDSTDLTQHHVVGPDDPDSAQTIENVTLTQANIVAVDDIDQSQDIDNIDLIQSGALVIDKLFQAQDVDAITLIQQNQLVVASLDQQNIVDVVELATASDVSINSLVQSQDIDNAPLTNIQFTLVVDDLDQWQALSNVEVAETGILIIDKMIQLQSIEETDLTQAGTLTVQSLLQAQDIDHVVFGGLVIGSLDGDVVVYTLLKADPVIFH